MLVEGPVDALAARWLHPGAVVWCCGGALRLDPGELPAGVDAVLIEADADAACRLPALRCVSASAAAAT